MKGYSARDLGLVAAALALFLDQASKLLLLYGFHFIDMAPGEHVAVLPCDSPRCSASSRRPT